MDMPLEKKLGPLIHAGQKAVKRIAEKLEKYFPGGRIENQDGEHKLQ